VSPLGQLRRPFSSSPCALGVVSAEAAWDEVGMLSRAVRVAGRGTASLGVHAQASAHTAALPHRGATSWRSGSSGERHLTP
jgi:hypothetical protein